MEMTRVLCKMWYCYKNEFFAQAKLLIWGDCSDRQGDYIPRVLVSGARGIVSDLI